MIRTGEVWKHVKKGTEYTVLAEGRVRVKDSGWFDGVMFLSNGQIFGEDKETFKEKFIMVRDINGQPVN